LGIPCFFPQNFEKITHRVQSKNKDQVRNYQDVLSDVATIGEGRVVCVCVLGGGGIASSISTFLWEEEFLPLQPVILHFQLITPFVLLPFLSKFVQIPKIEVRPINVDRFHLGIVSFRLLGFLSVIMSYI
jgi:hypothetical protein